MTLWTNELETKMKKQLCVWMVLALAALGCDAGTDSAVEGSAGQLAGEGTSELAEEGTGTDATRPEEGQVTIATPPEEIVEGDESVEVAPEEGEEVELVGSGICVTEPTTEPGTLCASIQMPEDAPGLPEKVSFHFFSSIPPFGPPTMMGQELSAEADLAAFEPGAEVRLVMENLPSEGELFLYAAVYMEGGGAQTWMVVPGVDYEGAADWETPITFTGDAINIPEPVELLIVK